MTAIAIITSTTRPGRKSLAVANWVKELADSHGNAEYTVVDIADFNLPVMDEPNPPAMQQYTRNHTKAWSAEISKYDGYIFVAAEYNHAATPALTNALSFLKNEFANKAAGFVSYGSVGGARAVENLRLIMAELQVATVRTGTYLSLFEDFENFTTFTPRDMHEATVKETLDQVVAWSGALSALRK